jgi:malate dehydrogenase (oxaloacetate-decarboxylating)
MAICAAHSIAGFAEKRGIHPDNIIPNMMESDLFPHVAADVAMQAVKEGLALNQKSWEEVYQTAKNDIEETYRISHFLYENGFIKTLNITILMKALEEAVKEME